MSSRSETQLGDTHSDDRCVEYGCSLTLLPGRRVERPCEKCGRATYIFEAGEGVQGIVIRTGDRPFAGPGAINLSLFAERASGDFHTRLDRTTAPSPSK